MRNLRLSWIFFVLVGFTEALIVLGALVRAHGAGLACPDWPLCFGAFVPRMDLRVAFEWSHRVLAGSIALGFAAAAVAALRSPQARRRVAGRIGLAGALLLVQIALGALTVWHLLAAWTVTSHLLVGNLFAATLFWIAWDLREPAGSRSGAVPAAARAGVLGVTALLAFQLLLGGLVASRYAGLACPDWPACRDGVFFPTFEGPVGLQVLHRTNGYLLLVALGGLALAARGRGRLTTAAVVAFALGGLQVVVGIANVLLRLPVEVTALHSGLAAALVLAVAFILRESLQDRTIEETRCVPTRSLRG